MADKKVVNKIEIKNFSFYYGKKQVIHNLNFNIAANKITGVFGPANSGTTTFLCSLNRLCELTHDTRHEGDILLDGMSIFRPEVSVTALRRKVGMVFEIPIPLPMSIYDNVAYGPRLKGFIKKSKLDDIVQESLEQAALWDEVSERLDMPALGLSGGQQQRLCVARTLALKPEILLIDRACSGLDPISTAKIEETLTQLKKDLTVVIAPHNTQQAIRVSDNAAFLLMGHLVEHGTNQEVFTSPKDQRTSDYVTGRFG
jgi:phosphate transport system ATP-binding protein